MTTPPESFPAADFVVVANRLPVDLEKLPDGTQRWKRSPGGLVTALEPMLRSREGAWVGWPGIPDAEAEPFEEGGITLHPVELTAQEVEDYYEGFSNGTLWPLYHDVVAPPAFHRHWWQAYVTVNQRFAEATAEVAAQGATVWVQDYQLQLLPAMLRELRPDLRIGFFLHIPFPPTELFQQLPWRQRIVEGLLGADLVGFHTPGGVRNFRWLASRFADAKPGHGRNEVVHGERTVRLGASAFCAGILGVLLADGAHYVRYLLEGAVVERGVVTRIGGGGFWDTAVVAGVIAVGLAEFIGETREALQGGPAVDGDDRGRL